MSFAVDRFFVPTIQWPWQVLMRTIRAAKDPNIDLFSEKGLWDPGMLPVFGMLASRKNDASAADLGIENPWAQFAADVALDPTTYMGAGLTKVGKAAEAFGKMRNGERMRTAIDMGGFTDHSTKVSAYQDFAKDALSSKGLSAAEGKAYLRYGELDEFKDMTADELMGKWRDRELMVGLPFLMGRGIGIRVPTSQQSWFKLAASGTRQFYTYATLTPALRKLPGIGPMIDKMGRAEDAIRTGLTTKIIPRVNIGGKGVQFSNFIARAIDDEHYVYDASGQVLGKYDSQELAEAAAKKMNDESPTRARASLDFLNVGAAGPEWAETHGGAAQILYKGLTNRNNVGQIYDLEIERGTDKGSAMLKALGLMQGNTLKHDSPTGRLQRFALASLDLKALPENGSELQNVADGWMARYNDAKNYIESSQSFLDPVSHPLEGNKLFEAGQSVRKLWNKAFRTDLTSEELIDLEMQKRSWEAGNDELVQSSIRKLALSSYEDAMERFPGLPPKEAKKRMDALVYGILESKIADEEVFSRRDAVLNLQGVEGLYNNIGSFLARGAASVKAIRQRIESTGRNTPSWQMELGRREDGSEFYAVTDYDLTREALGGSKELEALAEAGESNYNLHREFRGETLVPEKRVSKTRKAMREVEGPQEPWKLDKEKLDEINGPVPEGSVRVYRIHSAKGSGVPSWVSDAQNSSGAKEAEGAWYTADPKNLEFYAKDADKWELQYADIDQTLLESYRVSNAPPGSPQIKFSADPANEFFLPKDLRGKPSAKIKEEFDEAYDEITPASSKAQWGEYFGFMSDDALQAQRARLVNRGDLNFDEQATLDAVESLIADRVAGHAKQAIRPSRDKLIGKGGIESSDGFRSVRSVEMVDADGVVIDSSITPTHKMTSLERAFVKMAAVRGEMRGWMNRNAGKPPSEVITPPALIESWENAAMEWNAMIDEGAEEAFGGSNRYLEALETTRSQIFEHHRKSGMLGAKGFPLGWVPRVSSQAIRAVLKQWANDAPDDVRKHLGVARSQLESRNLDMLTIDQLQVLEKQILAKENPALAAKLRDHAQKAGIDLNFYATDPGQALMTALANAQAEASHAKFVNRALESGADTHLIGGKIVGTWDRVGDEIRTKYGSPRIEQLEDSVSVRVGDGFQTMETPLGGFLIEGSDGKLHRVASSDLGANKFRIGALSRMGATTGDSLAIALGTGDFIDVNSRITGAAAQELIGRHVLFGTDAHVGSMVAASRLTMTKGADMFRAVDAVNFQMKKWQTLYRVSFHVSNFISGIHQSMMIGTSLRGTIAGHGHAFRFLFGGGAEEIAKFDRLGAILGESRIIDGMQSVPVANQFKRVAKMVDAIRRAGHNGAMTADQMVELGLADVAARTFEVGKTRISGTHLINALARGDFLGTYAARGFGGGASITDDVTRLYDEAEKIASGSKRAILGENIRGVAEVSEVVSRFSAVFGQIHDGVPIELAIKNVKNGFVDYNQLTQFERSTLKRIFAYYTFPRHYVPAVWKELAKNPGQIGVLAHGIRDSGMIDTSGGDVQLKAGNLRVALSRTNANIDAIMAAPALAERLIGGSKDEADLYRNLKDPGFMSTGGLASIAFGRDAFLSLDTEMPQQHWMETAMNSTFATKWIYQGAVKQDLDWGDEAVKYLVPARFVEDGHEKRILYRNYKVLEAQIRDRMINAKSEWRREALRKEYQSINQAMVQAAERL